MAYNTYRTLTFAIPVTRSRADDSGMWLSVHTDRQATVIAFKGEIDAYNADDVRTRVLGLIATGRALIVDLSGVEFLGVAGLRAILAIGEACTKAHRGWALITSDAVNLLLRVANDQQRLPLVDSMSRARRLATSPDPGCPTPADHPVAANEMLATPAACDSSKASRCGRLCSATKLP